MRAERQGLEAELVRNMEAQRARSAGTATKLQCATVTFASIFPRGLHYPGDVCFPSSLTTWDGVVAGDPYLLKKTPVARTRGCRSLRDAWMQEGATIGGAGHQFAGGGGSEAGGDAGHHRCTATGQASAGGANRWCQLACS